MYRVVHVQLQVPSCAVVHEAELPAERTDTFSVPCRHPPNSPQRPQITSATRAIPQQDKKKGKKDSVNCGIRTHAGKPYENARPLLRKKLIRQPK